MKPRETKKPQIFKKTKNKKNPRKQEGVESRMYFQYILYMYYTCIVHKFKLLPNFIKLKY